MVELLEPVDETSPVNKTLEKNGVTPYHTYYIVDNLEEATAELREMRYVQVRKPADAVAIGNCRVAFYCNKNVGVIKLVEAPATITTYSILKFSINIWLSIK